MAERRAKGTTAKRLKELCAGSKPSQRQQPLAPQRRHAARTPSVVAVQPSMKRPGGHSGQHASPENQPTAMQETTLMEEALGAAHWEAALRAVERNAGAPGPDGMKSEELREHLARHGERIKARL